MSRRPTENEKKQVEGMICTMGYVLDNEMELDTPASKVLIVATLMAMTKSHNTDLMWDVLNKWEAVENSLIVEMGYKPLSAFGYRARANDMAKFLRTGDRNVDHITALEVQLQLHKNHPNEVDMANLHDIVYAELSDYLVKAMGY